MDDKILVVAAHPDDEILGCGGTAAKLANDGWAVYTLILGTGIASRHKKSDQQKITKQINQLRKNALAANKVIGVKNVFVYDFPDNSFDTVPLLNIVKVIEEIKNRIKPNIIFTNYKKDLNIDHQITYNAVITASRPVKEETVKEIYAFEVLSSTEWCYPLTFSPNVFFDISKSLDLKIGALSKYKSELMEFPHPRSLKAVELNAKVWGMKVGVDYAEAFECVRCIK